MSCRLRRPFSRQTAIMNNVNAIRSGHVFLFLIGIVCFSLYAAVGTVCASTDRLYPSAATRPLSAQDRPADIFESDQTRDVNFCIGEVGFGPLRLRSQSPFQSLRLGLTALAPSTISRNEWEVFIAGTLANVWANTEDEYFFDYEMLGSQVSLAYGISNAFKLEIGYHERRIFGGVLDGFIAGFHDAFGIDQDGRNEHPYGDVRVDIQDKSGESTTSRDEEGVISRGLELAVQHNVTCGTRGFPSFSYAVQLRYTLEDSGPVDRDKPIDFGLSIASSKRFSDLYLYLGGGYFFYGSDKVGGIKLRKEQKSGMLAFEWRYVPSQSVLLQFLATEGQAVDLGSFSDYSYEVTLGWKWEMLQKYVFELGLIENVIIYDNSPDFGIHTGISHRF